MTHKHLTIFAAAGGALLLPLGVFAVVQWGIPQHALSANDSTELHGGPETDAAEETLEVLADSSVLRQARQLDRRLKDRGITTPGPVQLMRALKRRAQLLNRSLTVSLQTDPPVAITLSVADHPDWLQLTANMWSADYHIDTQAVERALHNNKIEGLSLVQDAVILSAAEDNKKILRAVTDADAKPGHDVDTAKAAHVIAKALEDDDTTNIVLAVTERAPTVAMTAEDGTVRTLTLLGTGMSDFAGSDPGRLWNLEKAFHERIHNVIVKPGGVFSLVDSLNPPVTLEKGWKEALGLFGGGAALTPGGGICQSATTTYRAALLSGLPIVQKRNHSLFVDHYEFYGIGLDATIFPGFHDMRFRNDTGSDIILQSRTEGVTAYVDIYGVDDGRTVTMEGPYFAGAKNRPAQLGPLSMHQIGWVRTVHNADGTVREQQPIVATYSKPLWSSLIKQYEGVDGMALLEGTML